MNYEAFVYLGKIDPLHVFLHNKSKYMEKMSKEDEEKMCTDIYCTMIHETMIKRNEKVLILNVDQTQKTNMASYIDHISFKPMKYTKECFETALFRIITAERSINDNVMVIKAIIENDKAIRFELMESKENILFQTFKTVKDKIKKVEDVSIKSIDEFIVIKPIPYLK